MQENILLVSSFFIPFIFQCNGVSWQRQLEHIAEKRLESQGLFYIMPSRRYRYDPRELTQILGVPNRPSHLPVAEAILPGHTLNRPALGMLKSSVKFPHKDLENGAGVYGGIENLGIKYDSKNERLLYTGFRRFPSDYIMVIPSNSRVNSLKPRFKVQSTVLDLYNTQNQRHFARLDGKHEKKKQLLKIIKKLNEPAIKGTVRVYFGDLNKIFLNNLKISEEDDTYHKLDKYDIDDNKYNLNAKKSTLRTEETEDQKQKLPILPTENTFDISTDQDIKPKKIHSLLISKNSFNHIKINPEAPEIDDLVPPNTDNDNDIRQWWYYHADDYKQFTQKKY